MDSLTSRLGQYLDIFLQPLVESIPVYLKDTKHLLQILENVQIDNSPCFLVTADI